MRREVELGRPVGLDLVPVERRPARSPRRCRPAGPTPTRRGRTSGSISGPSTTTPSQPCGTWRRAASAQAGKARAMTSASSTSAQHGYVGWRADAAGCARSTISCSTCGAPSACSRRSATRGRTPTSSRPSTTRRAPRGGSPRARRRPRSCSACGPTARTFRPLLPLYPHAIESLDLRGYDIVISSSSAWAHGVLVDPGAVHVCYCHNPFRYAWIRARGDARRRATSLTRPALRVLLSRWRQWDWIAAQRVDAYVANSAVTAARHPALLRARGDGPAPAGGARALLARARSARTTSCWPS